MLKEKLKKIRSSNPNIYNLFLLLITFPITFFGLKRKIKGKNNKVSCKKTLIKHTLITINGNNNKILIGPESFLINCNIYIRGNNHIINLEKKVKLFDSELWIEDRSNSIRIGKSTSINGAHIAVTGHNRKIEIGEDCLFSKNIDIRNGDSHSIIDLTSNKRINYEGDIKIGNHVWLGKFVKILKNSIIEDNSIIGIDSLVNTKIGNNCLAVGSPAKVIKKNITWKHERIIDENSFNY